MGTEGVREGAANVDPMELDNEEEVVVDVPLIFKTADFISATLRARLYRVGTWSLLTCIHGT